MTTHFKVSDVATITYGFHIDHMMMNPLKVISLPAWSAKTFDVDNVVAKQPGAELHQFTIEKLNASLNKVPCSGDMLLAKQFINSSPIGLYFTRINVPPLLFPITAQELNSSILLSVETMAWITTTTIDSWVYVVPFYRLYVPDGPVVNLHPLDVFEYFDIVSGHKGDT